MATIRAVVDDYLQHLTLAGRSERTSERYRAYIDDFLRFLAAHGVPDTARASRVTREHVNAYQVAVAGRRTSDGPLSLSTRNLYASALRGVLRHGVKQLGLDIPAPDTVILAKVGDRTTRRMDVSDFERLVAAIRSDSENALRDRALLEALFATGCRVSELCSLTRRRVNLKTREVEILGKGKKLRGTFLTPEAAGWLGRYLATRKDDSPYLFISSQTVRNVRDPKTGQRVPKKSIYPLAPRTVQELVERLAMRAALPDDVSPHWFRHGRLTIVARHAGLLAAQELAGHASPNTTRRYTRITSSELKRQFDDAERKERALS